MKITVPTTGGLSKEIEAEVTGEWATHRSIECPAWCVTHVPSGMRIPRDLTQGEATALAARLVKDMPTLNVERRLHVGQPKVKDLGPAYEASVDRLVAIVKDQLGEDVQ